MQGAGHEAVVIPPRMGRNEASAVRSARPKGKKCRPIIKLRTWKKVRDLVKRKNNIKSRYH